MVKYLGGGIIEGSTTGTTITTDTDDFTPQLTWGQTGDKYSIANNKVECAGYTTHNPNDFVYYDLGANYHAFDNDWTLKLKTFKSGTGASYLEFGITSDISNGDGGSMINGSINRGGGADNYPRINGAYGGNVYEHVTGSTNASWNNVVYSELKFDKATNTVTQKGFTNSDYSTGQIGSTLSYTITPSDYSGMRYLFIGAITATGRTDSSTTYADDLDFTYTAISDEKTTLTNIEAGTQYRETDTRKIYRRKGAPTADFEDDFSSDNWTDVGNTGVSGGVLSYNGIANGSDHRSHTSLGLTLSDTEWILRVKYRVSAQNIPSMWILGLVDTTGNPTGTTQDALILFHSETYKFALATKNASSVYIDGSATDSDVSISLDTDYYVELARTSATNLRLKVFTDSSYTTQTGTTLNLTISSSIGSLDNITTATQTGGSSVRTLTSQADDLKVYNGVTSADPSWVERGTA